MKRLVLPCLVLALVILGAPSMWGAVRQGLSNPGLEALAKLQSSYTPIETVHLEATFVMKVHEAEHLDTSGGPVQGTGHLEYWGKGNLFHIQTETDSRLGLLGNTEIAYDGETYQRFLPDSSILTLQDGNNQQVMALPNPLFLPVDFLSRDTDACPFCALRLSDLQASSTWESVRSTFGEAMKLGDGDLEMVSIPGGEKKGRTFSHRVTLAAEPAGFPLASIDRVTPDGKKLMTLRFPETDTFRGAGVVATLPRIIDITIYDETKTSVSAEVRYFISELTLNQPLGQEAFQIDRSKAEHIWNEDSRQWLKHPEPAFAAPGR